MVNSSPRRKIQVLQRFCSTKKKIVTITTEKPKQFLLIYIFIVFIVDKPSTFPYLYFPMIKVMFIYVV